MVPEVHATTLLIEADDRLPVRHAVPFHVALFVPFASVIANVVGKPDGEQAGQITVQPGLPQLHCPIAN